MGNQPEKNLNYHYCPFSIPHSPSNAIFITQRVLIYSKSKTEKYDIITDNIIIDKICSMGLEK